MGYDTIVLTAVWKRPRITEVHFRNLRKLGLPVYVAVSEDWAEQMCEKLGFTYVRVENRPLGNKKNKILKRALMDPWDQLIETGSDNLFDVDRMEPYLDMDVDYYGVQTQIMTHPETERAKLVSYNMHSSSIMGSGRVISRDIIEEVWKHRGGLWKWNINESLDTSSDRRMRDVGAKPKVVGCAPIFCAIKSEVNIRSFDNFDGFTLSYAKVKQKFPLLKTLHRQKQRAYANN